MNNVSSEAAISKLDKSYVYMTKLKMDIWTADEHCITYQYVKYSKKNK